jgi:DNA modification methylase
VLDPFLGTGTTCSVARRLGRNCIGYEIDMELREAIEERLGMREGSITKALGVNGDNVEIIIRDDARRLRTKLRREIERKLNERGR